MNDEICGRISSPDICGTVRLGAPEAFAANHMQDVLIQFSKSHPSVALEVNCDLSHNLLEGYEKGDFDVILFKRSPKMRTYGQLVWHETLIWVGAEKKTFCMDEIVPLALSPYPCVYREKMTAALDKKKIKWKAVFTSASMTGRIAAARAGLAVTAIPKELLSQYHGLFLLGENSGLPKISPIEIAMLQNENTKTDASSRLAEHIVFALENNPSLVKKA
jgi:DNA-binding transcriptional LysR family regulator